MNKFHWVGVMRLGKLDIKLEKPKQMARDTVGYRALSLVEMRHTQG